MNTSNEDAITRFFAHDHRLIDRLLDAAGAETDPDKARAALGAFQAALERHMDREERLLFPAFERTVGEEAAARVIAMRVQHDELRALIAQLRDVRASDVAARRNLREALLETLSGHNHAEEEFIYPWIDGAMKPQERDALLALLA